MTEENKVRLEQIEKVIADATEMLANAESSLDVKNITGLLKEAYAARNYILGLESEEKIKSDELDYRDTDAQAERRIKNRELDIREAELEAKKEELKQNQEQKALELEQAKELETLRLAQEWKIFETEEKTRKIENGIKISGIVIGVAMFVTAEGFAVLAANESTTDLNLCRGAVDLARRWVEKKIV